jgi:hypothetical protein
MMEKRGGSSKPKDFRPPREAVPKAEHFKVNSRELYVNIDIFPAN